MPQIKKSGQARGITINKPPLSVRQFPIKKGELNWPNGARSQATCEKPGVNRATDLTVGQPPPYGWPPEGAAEPPSHVQESK